MGPKQEVLARAIIEVVGKPKEHVEKAMQLLLDKIGTDEGISIKKKEVFKPKFTDPYFSCFAELELLFDEPLLLVGFCFDNMPSSIEIIEPDEMRLSLHGLADLLNDLLSRLHTMNMSLSNINAEKAMLEKNAQGLLKNIVMLSLRDKPKSMAQLAADVGIKPKELSPFIEIYVKQKRIVKEKEGYRLAKSLYDNGTKKRD